MEMVVPAGIIVSRVHFHPINANMDWSVGRRNDMKRTVLLRRTPLKAKKCLNQQSAKAKLNESLWQSIKLARCMLLMAKYGHVICEYCGRTAWANVFGQLDAHHIDGNHKNSVEDNCYICHRICHDEIKRLHLRVRQLGFEGIKNADS